MVKAFKIVMTQIKPVVDMVVQILFIYKLYWINRTEDMRLTENGGEGQMVYKFVGFAFLILNLGPYLIDYSQTIYELLVTKSF